MLATSFLNSVRAIVGPDYVRDDAASLDEYGTDALKRGHPADLVVLPGTTGEVSAIAQLCNAARVPLVPRGAFIISMNFIGRSPLGFSRRCRRFRREVGAARAFSTSPFAVE